MNIESKMFQNDAIFFDHLMRIDGLFNENDRKNGPSWGICSRYLFSNSLLDK